MMTGMGKVQDFLQRIVDFCGGTVGVFGQQESVAASVDVGDVDRAIGADQPVMCLGDKDAAFAAYDATALGEGDFDHAGVEVVSSFWPTVGTRRRDGRFASRSVGLQPWK